MTTIFDRIKNNTHLPIKINTALIDEAYLNIDLCNESYPLRLFNKDKVWIISLNKSGKYTDTKGGKCLIFPVNVPSWENVHFPNIGEYITVNDNNKLATMYVTEVFPNYFKGIEIESNPGFRRIWNSMYDCICEKYKYNKATQDEIDSFNTTLAKINVEIKDGRLCVIENNKPKSWEEYCKDPIKGGWLLFENRTMASCNIDRVKQNQLESFFPTMKLATAMSAFKKLVILRHVWIEDWEPTEDGYWSIHYKENKSAIVFHTISYKQFSFPTKKMANEFLNAFKDLFNEVKELILCYLEL